MSQQTIEGQNTLYQRAKGVMASGLSASMRMHPYLGRPFYSSHGDGAYLYDLEGKRFIDYNMSNGATMLGHNHPAVRDAVQRGLEMGIITAAETPFHEELAETICAVVPAAERVRFSSVGSEVTIVALRIARNATGRTKFLKFDGHFHGLVEQWLFKRQDPTDPNSPVVPSSGGVPEDMADDVVMIPWNDADAFEKVMAEQGDELAAVVCEPIFYNAGCIPPEPGFLELLRQRTTEHGTILFFDEVLSGCRTALGGVQAESGVTPDLTTHAKALANGMPLASVSGRADLMEQLAPTGPVAHSGTYSGHLLSVLSALATLNELRQPGVYERLNETGDAFYRDLQAIFDRNDIPAVVQGRGARFGLYFGFRHPVRTYTDAMGHDHELARQFTIGCLDRGVYFHAYNRLGPPGHAGFSLSHTQEDFATTLTVAEDVAKEMAGK
jgi:glutamate-1-semialdehyde 2,1-aminomutase